MKKVRNTLWRCFSLSLCVILLCGLCIGCRKDPADTEAETGTFGDVNAHNPVFSATILRMVSTTCSMFSSEVSTFTESRAIFSGAMGRWVSW